MSLLFINSVLGKKCLGIFHYNSNGEPITPPPTKKEIENYIQEFTNHSYLERELINCKLLLLPSPQCELLLVDKNVTCILHIERQKKLINYEVASFVLIMKRI